MELGPVQIDNSTQEIMNSIFAFVILLSAAGVAKAAVLNKFAKREINSQRGAYPGKGKVDLERVLHDISQCNETTHNLNHLIKVLNGQNLTNAAQIVKLKDELSDRNEKISQNTQQIISLEAQLEHTKKDLVKCREIPPNSCLAFGNSSAVHQIKARGLDPFEVLCDSQTAGKGWTVIQQRLDGKENFSRTWSEYRQGFGKLNGDFFLGLEKIHRLTSEQPHELYIHMEMFNGSVGFARYNHFVVSDEYRISRLGKMTGGTVSDNLRQHVDTPFSTYDRDNDDNTKWNCAENNGGWWYINCHYVNLNGVYFNREVRNTESMYWHEETSLKKVRMLIRPVLN